MVASPFYLAFLLVDCLCSAYPFFLYPHPASFRAVSVCLPLSLGGLSVADALSPPCQAGGGKKWKWAIGQITVWSQKWCSHKYRFMCVMSIWYSSSWIVLARLLTACCAPRKNEHAACWQWLVAYQDARWRSCDEARWLMHIHNSNGAHRKLLFNTLTTFSFYVPFFPP